MTLVLEDIDELDDVWVIDLLQNINFSLHGDLVFFVHLLLAKYLHGISDTRGSILGFLHGGETTLSDSAFNLVGFLNVPKSSCSLHF